MSNTPSDDWVGAPAAARLLGVQLVTLYRLIDRDGLPAYRLGRVLRLRRTDIDEWLAGRRVQPGELRRLYSGAEPPEPDVTP